MQKIPALKRLLDHWPQKVISLLAAVVIFVFYRFTTQREFNVPLHINTPPGLAVASDYPAAVTVVVRGMRNVVIKEEDFKARLDLSAAPKPGRVKGTVQLEKTGNAAALGNTEFEYRPGNIELELEPEQERQVPVLCKVAGNVPRGYSVDYFTDPREVRIKGPQSRVATVAQVFTEEINLAGKKESIKANVKLFTGNRFVTVPDADQVVFYGVITEVLSTREFDQADIISIDLSPRLRLVTPLPKARLKVQGSLLELEKTAASLVRLLADCKPIAAAGEYILVLTPDLPQGMSVLEYAPKTLTMSFADVEG